MIVLKVLAIIAIVLVALFLLTLVIYFFNLDMKFCSSFNQAAYCILQLVKEQAREKERTEYTERITGRAETSNGFI